jgi:hypothetical protein
MKKRIWIGLYMLVPLAGMLGIEPAVRDEQTAIAVSAWEMDGDGGSWWCEGCCTSVWLNACCIVSAPCRHPYPEDPD